MISLSGGCWKVLSLSHSFLRCSDRKREVSKKKSTGWAWRIMLRSDPFDALIDRRSRYNGKSGIRACGHLIPSHTVNDLPFPPLSCS
jgi:hypothetical protein